MKILVTGATGFIGGYLIEKLTTDGYEVKALVREASNISSLKNLDIEIVYGDISDADAVNKSVKGCQHVYHLAVDRLASKNYYSANLEGTKNVAEAVIKYNAERLVYASSCGIYGIIKNPPVDEQTPPNPNSLYQKFKLLEEKQIFSYYKSDSLPVVAARLTSVFGPRSLKYGELFQSIYKKKFRIIGNGENYNHMIYISDAVNALRCCAEAKNIEGQCYLVASNEAIKLKEFVDLIAKELNVDVLNTKMPEAPFHALKWLCKTLSSGFGFELPLTHRYNMFFTNSIFCIDKAQAELGFFPQVSMQAGITQTITWYRQQGYF